MYPPRMFRFNPDLRNDGKEGDLNRHLRNTALNGNIESMAIYIKQGADVNAHIATADGGTPLIAATQEGKVEAVQFLLNNGALVNECDNYGRAPLHYAAHNNHREIVEILL